MISAPSTGMTPSVSASVRSLRAEIILNLILLAIKNLLGVGRAIKHRSRRPVKKQRIVDRPRASCYVAEPGQPVDAGAELRWRLRGGPDAAGAGRSGCDHWGRKPRAWSGCRPCAR